MAFIAPKPEGAKCMRDEAQYVPCIQSELFYIPFSEQPFIQPRPRVYAMIATNLFEEM